MINWVFRCHLGREEERKREKREEEEIEGFINVLSWDNIL
jgi:hypothetical protein